MARKSNTDEPTEYDAIEEGIIESILDRAMGVYEGGGGTPSRINVTARIEWAGVEQNTHGGVRHTTLEGLNLAGVQEAIQTAREARERADQAQPYRSYQAKGWHAQINELVKAGDRGSAAADRAGLDVTRDTLRAWLSETQEPNKANQERIAEAYDAMRNREVNAARDVQKGAQHEAAQALNAALRDRYGAEVRLRDIAHLSFE